MGKHMDIKSDALQHTCPRLFHCILLSAAILMVPFLCACDHGDKQQIRDVLMHELGMLRDLDQDTVREYIDYSKLLPFSQALLHLKRQSIYLF